MLKTQQKLGKVCAKYGITLSDANVLSSTRGYESCPTSFSMGSIIYAMTCTRSDDSYALSMTSWIRSIWQESMNQDQEHY